MNRKNGQKKFIAYGLLRTDYKMMKDLVISG
jgi:hypothetical protein